MKGVILNINPTSNRGHLPQGGLRYFDARSRWPKAIVFPPDTIHLVVVDPGVGTVRRPLLVRTMAYKSSPR